MAYQAKVSDWKKQEVKEFQELIDQYDVIGIVNMKDLPAKQLQEIRAELRGTIELRMTKQSLMKLAFEESDKKNVGKLEEYFEGMPAMLFSNENPFKLHALLKKNKSKAPIKGGQEAPHDITVHEGPTDFMPGPIIGELGNHGIPAGVDEGKVAIQEDTVVAEEGETVDAGLASIITRMGIEPMQVGLDLVAVWEEGEVIPEDILDIDHEEYENNFRTAARQAFNLSINAGYPTKDNIRVMLGKAHSDVLSLARSEDIVTEETVKEILSKAASQAAALEGQINIEELMEKAEGEPAGEEEAGGEESEEPEETEEKEESGEGEESDSAEEKGGDEEAEDSGEEAREEIPSRSEVENMTKDEIKEYASDGWNVELSTDDLKDDMIDQLFDEIE